MLKNKQIKFWGNGYDLRRLRLLADKCDMSHGEIMRTMLKGMSADEVLDMAKKVEDVKRRKRA